VKNKAAVAFVVVVAALIFAGLWALFAAYPMLPAAASKEAEFVDGAFNGLFWIEGAIYALVMAFMLYCLVQFRASSRAEQGAKFDRSRSRLVEVAWIGLSTMLTLGLAALGSHELHAVIGSPEADIDVEVRGQQFSWEFYYPKLQQYGDKLYLEVGKRHRIILTSKDVVHSFWVPEFRLKQDAVPGKVIHLLLTPTKVGDYMLICSELCGFGHTDMTASVAVVDHETFEKNLKSEF